MNPKRATSSRMIAYTGILLGLIFPHGLTAEADDCPTWPANQQLTNETGYQGTSDHKHGGRCIVADSEGNIHLFSIEARDGRQDVYHRYLDAETRVWDDSTNVSETPEGRTVKMCEVACDSIDNLHVVWWGLDSGDGARNIYYRKRTSGTWGTVDSSLAIYQVSDSTQSYWGKAFSPSIAVDGDASVYMSFNHRYPWPREWTVDTTVVVRYSKRDHSSGTWSDPVPISNQGCAKPDSVNCGKFGVNSGPSRIAVHAGHVHAAWRDDDNIRGGSQDPHRDDDDIFYSYQGVNSAGAGNWKPKIVVCDWDPNDGTEAAISGRPDLAIDSDSTIHVAWRQIPPSNNSSSAEIYWRSGSLVSSGDTLAMSWDDYATPIVHPDSALVPSLWVGPDDDLHACWWRELEFAFPADVDYEVAYQRMDNGSWDASTFRTIVDDNEHPIAHAWMTVDHWGYPHFTWGQENTSGNRELYYTYANVISDSLSTIEVNKPFLRGLSPCGTGTTDSLIVTITVKDCDGNALSGIPAEWIYVIVDTLWEDCYCPCDSQCDSCAAYGPSDYDFFTGPPDTLFATSDTDASGETVIVQRNFGGRAKLELTAHIGETSLQQPEVAWVNSPDFDSDGDIDAGDFAAFTTFYELSSPKPGYCGGSRPAVWCADFVGSETCESEDMGLCVVGPDYAYFATHYSEDYPDDCGGSKRISPPPSRERQENNMASVVLELAAQHGEVLSFDLLVQEASSVLAVDLRLEWNPQEMSFISWLDGDFLPEALRIGPSVDAEQAQAAIALAATGGRTVSAPSGHLGSVQFRAIVSDPSPPLITEASVVDGALRARDILHAGDAAVHRGNLVSIPTHFNFRLGSASPFRQRCDLRFDLPIPVADVSIKIYGVLGREVCTLVSAGKPAGSYSVQWDLRDSFGRTVAPGVYFARMETAGFSKVRKIVLVR